MNLININKQTGAKRLHRKYLIENMGDFVFSKAHFLEKNIIEFETIFEEDFKTEVEDFKKDQRTIQTKELRVIQVPTVKDATLEQGTKEWLQARVGIITASSTPFTIKGLKIPTYDDYVNKKVAEAFRLENGLTREDNHTSVILDNGIQLEPRAIENYEKETGNKVVSKGLVVGVDMKIGASTDGVTTNDSFNKINIEIKSVLLHTYLSELTKGSLVNKYYAQMQVQMYVLDIDLTHFLVQCQETDGLKLIIREVNRDEEYISNMVETIKDFEKDFKEKYDLLIKQVV